MYGIDSGNGYSYGEDPAVEQEEKQKEQEEKENSWNEVVDKKGFESARLHFGVVAQDVLEAFRSEGLDASKYGLICKDEWDAHDEIKDVDGNVICGAIESGDRYGIRYEEALVLECAYLRDRLSKAEERIAALEAKMEK